MSHDNRARVITRGARRSATFALAAAAIGAAAPVPIDAQSLRGSKASVERMYWFAQGYRMPFRATPEAIAADASAGKLVPLGGSLDYEITTAVGWPYVTAETRQFVERFAEQYSAVCEMPLVVTSASRPLNRQPRNANPHSVHPAGIAVDFRRPPRGPCLDWTRKALLELERRGTIEAIEERHPVHFHVAVLSPRGRSPVVPPLRVAGMDPIARRPAWLAVRESYAATRTDSASAVTSASRATIARSERAPTTARTALRASLGTPFDRRVGGAPVRQSWPNATTLGMLADATPAPITVPGVVVTESAGDVAIAPDSTAKPAAPPPARVVHRATGGRTYRVRPGDTLWDIARRHRTKVDAIVAENRLRKRASLRPGVVLRLPETATQ